MTVKIEIVNELSDSLLVEMDELNKYSSVPKISTSSFYLKTFSEHLLKDWKPLFVRVLNTDTNNLIGIVPLMYKTFYRRSLLPYKIVKFYASTFSDFHDIYSSTENRGVVIEGFLDWLYNSGFTWHEVILDDLLESSGIVYFLDYYLKKNNLKHKIKKGKYFYINLKRPWEDVKTDTSKSFVWKNVRLAKNRISKAGNWTIEYNPKIDAQEIVMRAAPIHIHRQMILQRESRFSEENYLKALNRIISHYQEKGQFQSFWLKFEGKYIAYMLGFYLENTFYWWNTAFMEEFKDFYPSRLLQYYVLEHMGKNGYSEFNFMRGESGYKDKWTKTTRTNFRYRLYNNRNWYGKFLSIFDSNFRE